MNITSDTDATTSSIITPDIPPPTTRRSPLVSGTYQLKKPSSDKPINQPHASVGPLTKSVKKTLAAITVTASVIGAISTIAGFAHSVVPQPPTPQPVSGQILGPIAVGVGNSIGYPLVVSAGSYGPNAMHSAPDTFPPVDPDATGGPLSAVGVSGKALGLCPLKHTTMDAKLSGYVARVNVTQVFTNPYKEKIEAVYNFPLSDDGAVDDMTIKIGDRTIKGEIKTREVAHKIYETARQMGQAAALLDQHRTNIFTQRVANIEPGQSIVVQISYVELLKFEDGRYTFTMPTTIGPRFFPNSQKAKHPNSASNDLANALSNDSIGQTIGASNLSINVDVDAGLPIKNIHSKLYPIMVDKENDRHARVSLRKSFNVPNKDFILTYELANAGALKSGYLAYRNDKAPDRDGYATFMLLPPAKVTSATAAAKEMIFLVDCSGSQAGQPIQKAKETLHYIVEHMNPNDTFQVLAFNSDVATLADQPIQAGQVEKLQAHQFINGLTAQGGTWMAPAVERVLSQTGADDKNLKRLRIVTFMTDGFVGNDLDVFSMIQRKRGDTRWFAFGTGDGVNHSFIDNVSRLGGGEADYVLLNSSAEEAGKKFYSRISSPALTDVTIKAEGLELYDVFPNVVSDVWANRPLYFTARYKGAGHGKVVLSGFANGHRYKQTLDVALPANDTTNSAIEKVWARQKIDSLADEDLQGLADREMDPSIQEAITKVALDHKLMSDFTSFVAVDTMVTGAMRSHKEPVVSLQPKIRRSQGFNQSVAAAAQAPANQMMAVATPTPAVQPTAMPAAAPAARPISVAASAPAQPTVVASNTAATAVAGPMVAAATYSGDAPGLQGATNGIIAPQGTDATVIEGINTSGSVRINNLANVEAVLNMLANGLEILGIAWGGPTMVIGLRQMARREDGGRKLVWLGALAVSGGLAAPFVINWLVACARDAALFN